MLKQNLLLLIVSFVLVSAKPAHSQLKSLDELSSIRGLQNTASSVKKSLKLPTGELSVGADAGGIPTSALLTNDKLDSTSSYPGVVTLCPDGVTDNQAKAGCKIIGGLPPKKWST